MDYSWIVNFFYQKVFDRVKEIGRMSTYAERAKFINKIEDKLCGRFERKRACRNKAVKAVKKSVLTGKGIELKSLILAQIERWRHA